MRFFLFNMMMSKFFRILKKPNKTEKNRPVTHDLRSVTRILQPVTRDLWPATCDPWPVTCDPWPAYYTRRCFRAIVHILPTSFPGLFPSCGGPAESWLVKFPARRPYARQNSNRNSRLSWVSLIGVWANRPRSSSFRLGLFSARQH